MRRLLTLPLALLLLGAVYGQIAAPSKPMLSLDAEGHTDVVRRVLFTPDGKQVVTVSMDKTVRVWNAETGETARIFRLPVGAGDEGSLAAAALSADGQLLALSPSMPVGRGKFGVPIYLISMRTGSLYKPLKGHEGTINGLSFSKDGKYLASASADGNAIIWDIRANKAALTLKGHPASVRHVAYSPDGKKLATVCADGSGRIFSVATGKTEASMGDPKSRLISLAWSPDGKSIATGIADASIKLWDPAGKAVDVVDKLRGLPMTVTFSSDSKMLLYTGTPLPGTDKVEFPACVVDISSGKEKSRCKQHDDNVFHGSFSPDGKKVVSTGGENNETFIWSVADGKIVHNLSGKGQTPSAVAWSPDGKAFAWVTTNGDKTSTRTFKLEDLELGDREGKDFKGGVATQGEWALLRTTTGGLAVKQGEKILHALDLGNPKERAYSYSWLKDGRAVVGGIGQMYLVDPKANRVVRRFVGHTSNVFAVAPSPDGKYILSGAADQTVRIWDPDKDEPLLSFFFTERDWIVWTSEGYYTSSPGGEQLVGWVVPRGADTLPTFYPASRFRASLHEPEVIKKVLPSGSVAKALLALGKKSSDIASVTSILPPQVTVTAPTVPTGGGPIQVADGGKLEVSATAKSMSNYAVTSMRLMVDGRPYKGQAGIVRINTGKPAQASWTVDLPPGSHTIAVQAVTQTSRSLSPWMEVNNGAKETGPPSLYVLAIGINDYPGSLKLRYAAPDAEIIAETLKNKSKSLFGKIETRVVTDKKATRKGISEGFEWLASVMTPRDVAVVSFSGHGANDKQGSQYLIPADVNVNNIYSTSIPGYQFKNLLGDLPGRVICILDACHSGGVAEGNKRKSLMDDLVRDLVSEEYGVIVLCSSAGSEVSLETSELKHGVFTTALVDGLNGKADLNGDGMIQLNELEGYAARAVRQMTGGFQNPVFAKPPNVNWFPLATVK